MTEVILIKNNPRIFSDRAFQFIRPVKGRAKYNLAIVTNITYGNTSPREKSKYGARALVVS